MNNPNGKPCLGIADTQTALAAKLQAHYGNRLSIQITKGRITEWKNGRQLRGAPLPPAIEGEYWNADKWVEWFDEHMLKHYLVSSDSQRLLIPELRLEQMKVEDELAELEQNKKKRAIEDGKYYTREEVAAAADAIGAKLKSALLENYEKLFERKLIEDVNAANLEDTTRQKLIEQLRNTGRAGTDAILAALSEKLKV